MRLIYTTLNNQEEARTLGYKLLEKNLANCVNYFPISCIYKYNNEITEEPEVVLIIKTGDDKFEEIQNEIRSLIKYDNFIGEIRVGKVNSNFENWLTDVVK